MKTETRKVEGVPVTTVTTEKGAKCASVCLDMAVNMLTFRSKAKLKEAVLDPEKKLVRLAEPLPEISEEAAGMLALGWSAGESPAVSKKVREEDIRNSDTGIGWECSSTNSGNMPALLTAIRKSPAFLRTAWRSSLRSAGWDCSKTCWGREQKRWSIIRKPSSYFIIFPASGYGLIHQGRQGKSQSSGLAKKSVT
jgi:hypothetical protein